MKNKKLGFTLIEVIAIIILLSVIALITYPVINNIIGDSRDELYDKQINELERISSMWVTKNIDKLKTETGYTYDLTFSELHEQGFVVDEDVENPKTGEDLEGCIKVIYNSSNNGYDVKYDSTCSTGSTSVAYKDNSGANSPVLYDNMIPIKYESNKWIYANTTQEWYDYNEKQWANAVVLNTGTTKSVGDEITEDDIALWYVWIPRYKYTIFNGNNESVSEQLISVTFESETNSTGTVKCINNTDGSETCTDSTNGSVKNGTSTYTHPAFTFGSTNLTGFWVGKFEVSGTTSAITVKPNVSSLRETTVSAFFTAIQNMTTTYSITNADSHMMKNMEWGAVAYLKQSKYGLGTTDIGINNNSSFITGCGTAGSGNSSTCNAYDTETGMLASTTGNIYGIYDMSGGAGEYVMGNMLSSSNSFYSSDSGFSSAPDSKYYDIYKYDTSYTTHERGKLGDATKETLKTFGNMYGGWYSDYARFLDSNHSWFGRGGFYGLVSNAGVFDFDYNYGYSNSAVSSRSVLSAP